MKTIRQLAHGQDPGHQPVASAKATIKAIAWVDPNLSAEERKSLKKTLFPSRKRHNHKAALIDDVLRQQFPPDGKPSRIDVPDFELITAVYAELKRREISKKRTPSPSTILRRAGR